MFFPAAWPCMLYLNPVVSCERQPQGSAFAYDIAGRNMVMQIRYDKMAESRTLWYPIGNTWLDYIL